MTLLEQVSAAIVSHTLEHGTKPNYIDAHPTIFSEMWLAIEEIKNANALLHNGIPVFREENMGVECIRLVHYHEPTATNIESIVKIGLKHGDVE